MKGTSVKKMDDEYQNFLEELGGTVPESLVKQNSSTLAIGSGSSGSNPPWGGGNNPGNVGVTSQAGLGANVIKPKEYDETNLYIGYLPPTLDDDGLISLFSAFGEIVMAKVIKDRMTGLSKGYGFVKYADVQQANIAIASMNGHLLDGRSIAVRVAGKPPQPTVPPGPLAPATPFYHAPNQSVGAYPSQLYTSGGATGTTPHGCYAVAPVPWGPPIRPSYTLYPSPPPPPGSTVYPPVPGQPVTPYVVHYPPPMQTNSIGAPAQTVTSGDAIDNYSSSNGTHHSHPPGVQSQSSTPVQSLHSHVYANSVTSVPPNVQPTYFLSSYTYPPYYGVVPPPPPISQSSADYSQSVGNVPWASNPVVLPPVSSSEKTNSSTDAEYEKFIAEMK